MGSSKNGAEGVHTHRKEPEPDWRSPVMSVEGRREGSQDHGLKGGWGDGPRPRKWHELSQFSWLHLHTEGLTT